MSDDRPRPRSDDDEDDDRPRRREKSGGTSGFTIGIIIAVVLVCGGLPVVAILIGLLLPAIQKVRGAAARVQEQNHLKQIGLGLHNDHDIVGGMYAPFAHDQKTGELYPGNSFRVSLLPYLEQENVYRQFDLRQPWDSGRNKAASDTLIKTYQSPHDAAPTVNTPFRAFVGGGAMFNEDGKPIKLAEVQDGTANTIMLVHAAEQVPWAKPQELRYGPGVPLPPLGHPGNKDGFNALFADGSVRFLRHPAPDAALRGLITRAGGEFAAPDW